MISLYITSSQPSSGKTTLCAGIARHLIAAGKKTGFFKPVIIPPGNAPRFSTDSDTRFIKELFSLIEPLEVLNPVFRNQLDLVNNIRLEFTQAAHNKDVVIIEGPSEYYHISPLIARSLDARVLIIEAYSGELLKNIESFKQFGQFLSGVILTKVPLTKMEQARKESLGLLEQAGVKLLGVLPEDRTLLSLSVSELAEFIHGDFVSGAEKSDELIENLVIATTGLDPGPDYYNRKANKALIFTRAPRYRHLSAVRSTSKCVVLTGPMSTNQTLIDEYRDKNIPVITTEDFISTLVVSLEHSIAKARFNQHKKMPRLTELLEPYLDFRALSRELGIAV